MPKKQPICSFCGKHPDAARTLIVGLEQYERTVAGICDECVDMCNMILREREEEQAQLGKIARELDENSQNVTGGFHPKPETSGTDNDGRF